MTNSQPTLTADQAKATLQFLARTQMQGAEMPAYVDVFNVLTAIAKAEASPPREAATESTDA